MAELGEKPTLQRSRNEAHIVAFRSAKDDSCFSNRADRIATVNSVRLKSEPCQAGE